MRLVVARSVDSLTHAAVRWVEATVAPGRMLLFAVGASVEGVYRSLACRQGCLHGVTAATLDELHPLPRSDSRAFGNRLAQLLGPTGARVQRFDPSAADPQQEAMRMEALADEQGVSGCVLGLGPNGHLAFNEPGVAFDEPARFVPFEPATLRHLGGQAGVAPATGGMTLSLGAIMRAHRLLLVVMGDKADAFRKLVWGPLTPDVPGSLLRLHPDVTVLVNSPDVLDHPDPLLELPGMSVVGEVTAARSH